MAGEAHRPRRRRSSLRVRTLVGLTVGALTLAACQAADTPGASSDSSTPASTAVEGEVSVYNGWTAGGELEALEAVIALMGDQYPDVTVLNDAVASDRRTVIQTRMQAGDQPDVWNTNPGQELFRSFVDPGYAASINDLYEDEDWEAAFPPTALDLVRRDGTYYAVLMGVHRVNGLWFNKKLLADQGIEVPNPLTNEEFIAIAEELDANGVTPLCVGDGAGLPVRPSLHIFDMHLLAAAGPEQYREYFDGERSWDDSVVREALANWSAWLDFQNEDHAAISWDQSIDRMLEGGCAFHVDPDWAWGKLASTGAEEDVDYGWRNFPGTEGVFALSGDTFATGTEAKNPAAAMAWLRVAGSREAQEQFSIHKGSIPGRSDVDRSLFGLYQNFALESFASDTVVAAGSLLDGTSTQFYQVQIDAARAFISDRDADAFIAALEANRES